MTIAHGKKPAHAIGIFENRSFKRLLIGQSFSMAGDAVCLAALPTAFIETGFETDVFGFTMASVALGTFLGAGCVGALTGKVCPKKAMVCSDITRGLLQVIATLLIVFHEPWWTLSLAYLAFGVCIGVSRPLAHVLIVTILSKDQLPSGNAVIHFIDNMAAIIFPATLGVAVIMGGAVWGIFLDGLTFFCAALFTYKMHTPVIPKFLKYDSKESMCSGVKSVLTSKTLLKGFSASLLLNVLCFPLFLSVAPFAVNSRFEAVIWGICLAACGVGACIGSIVATRAKTGQHLTLLSVVSAATLSLAFLLLGLGESVWVVIVGAIGVGFVEAMWLTGWSTIMQTETPLNELAKVAAFDTLLTSGLHPVVYWGVGTGALLAGHSQILIYAALASLTGVLLPLLFFRSCSRRKKQNDHRF